MDFFKTLISSIEQQDAEIDRFVTEASSLFEQVPAASSIGIRPKSYGPGKNVPVRKGDVIIDATNENRLSVATGEYRDDKPIVKTQDGQTAALEPEFVLMGVAVNNPAIRQAAKKLAIQYPDRRILTYGMLPSRDGLGESKAETTAGATVHNDAHPWTTFIDAANKDPEVKGPKKKKKDKK